MKITGFERAVCVDEFCYTLRTGEHETCRFSVLAGEKDAGACLERLEQPCTLEDGAFRFSGTVTNVAVTRGMDWCRVEAVVQGNTIQWDQTERCRVFQSEEKTISDILQHMGLSEIRCSGADDKAVRRMLVQDRETDWQFLRRLAAYTGTRLFPGEAAWIGGPRKDTEELEARDIVELRVELDRERSGAVCRTKKRLKPGVQTRFYGKTFFVDGVTYRKDREEYFYEYHLLESGRERERGKLPVYILPARVADNADPDRLGRVRLEFTEPYENIGEGVWVECAALWASEGLGAACVPWKDDAVEVRIYDGEARVCASRRRTAFDDRFQEPDSRCLFLGRNTCLIMNDEEITLDNSTCKLTVNGDRFTLRFGDQLSVEIEEGKLTVHADKTALELSGGTKLVTQGLEMDGKDKAAVTASKVEIKGSRGVSIN